MTVSLRLLLILCPLVFLAGFIDSIAGGGGLITLTSYISCGIPVPFALGTNKFASFCGSLFASGNYIRTRNYEAFTLIVSIPFALIGSLIGSYCTLLVSSKVIEILLLIATPIIAFMVLKDKNYDNHEKQLSTGVTILLTSLIGLIVGFYDGFYGPGTGMFLQMGYILIVGINIKKACGNARIVNFITNMGALITFVRTGNVLYSIGIPCAVFSIAGNILGSSLAIKKDVKIVKPMMITVVFLLFTKILLSQFGILN